MDSKIRARLLGNELTDLEKSIESDKKDSSNKQEKVEDYSEELLRVKSQN